MTEQDQEVKVEQKPQMNTIERITLLADLANAAQDTEIVNLLKSRKNGERLYTLFVQAVSEEIESIMNPGQAQTPKVMQDAQQVANQIYQIIQRIGGTMSAIEQGPGLAVLQMMVQNLGGLTPTRQAYQQQQQIQQPQQQTEEYQPSGSRRGSGVGGLGSW